MLRIILLLIYLPAIAFGTNTWKGKANGGFSVEITLSTLSLPVDETLDITLLLRYPDTHTVDLDKVRMNILQYAGISEPPFALISETIEERAERGKLVTFTLEPLLEGFHFLSLFDITFPPKDEERNSTVTIFTNIFEIEASLPPIEKNYRGLPYPLLSLTKRFPITITQENRLNLLENPLLLEAQARGNVELFNQKTLPWPEISGVFLFLIVLLIARMQPKRKPDLKKQRRKIALSARKKAIQALASLENRNLPQKSEFEKYFVDLTYTVRRFIEENYQIRASTKTTLEFLEAMTKNPSFDEETKTLLKDFLIRSDRVKFAEHEPTIEECREAHQMAKQFIEQTKVLT